MMQQVIDRIRFPVLGCFYAGGVAPLRSRSMLPFYLNCAGLVGQGAEIGVQRAHFSEHLLRYWKGHTLFCIDPWRYFGSGDYIEPRDNVANAVHEDYYREALARLHPFGSRAQILRETSIEAAATIPNGSLDFIFIDAQHHYSAVQADLAAWVVKVRTGGLLSGHDWDLDYGPPLFGVRKAVEEFTAQRNLPLQISTDKKSWFVRL